MFKVYKTANNKIDSQLKQLWQKRTTLRYQCTNYNIEKRTTTKKTHTHRKKYF